MTNAPNIAELDYLRETVAKLTTAAHGQKGAIVTAACLYLSISKAELYRRLETVGYVSERKTRADKGKTSFTADQAAMLGGMVHIATRANGKRTMPIKLALDILQADGKAPSISAATAGRIMRQFQCHPDQLATPTAHIQQRSLHPNHVWQIDASVCVLFYLPKGGMQVMDEKKFYKNKPENLKKIENERVIRYVITDHHSGSVYVEYVGGSEDSTNLTNVFLNAIQRRSHQEPLHGVPFILYLDKGSANTSGLFKNLLARLQVEMIAHAAGNPRAKGQVEQANNLVETQYEGRLRFKQINSIAELNTDVAAWRQVWNETAIHSRTKRTRNAVWQTINSNQLRIAPSLELCRELVNTRPETKTVSGNLTISHSIKSYGQNTYDVRHIDGVYPKAKLDIVVNPYRAPCIDILSHDQHGQPLAITIEPRQLDWVGFSEDAPVIGQRMASMPDSAADQQRKQMLKQAYNADTQADVDKAIKAKRPAFSGALNVDADLQQVSVPDYLPRAGQQLSTPSVTRQTAPLSLIEAAREIKGLVGDLWTANHYKALANSYPDNQVPSDAVAAIAAAIRGDDQKPTLLRIVGA